MQWVLGKGDDGNTCLWLEQGENPLTSKARVLSSKSRKYKPDKVMKLHVHRNRTLKPMKKDVADLLNSWQREGAWSVHQVLV